MLGNFDRAVGAILRHEGGYVDHPADPGGATNLGITHITLAKWRGKPVSKADVRALTRAEACDIYRAWYWDAINCSDMPSGVDLAAFDFAVNAGQHRSAKLLQDVIGTDPDGVVGPATLKRLSELPAASVINEFSAARLIYYRGLKTWATFGKGWARRVEETRQIALSMAGKVALPAPQPATPTGPNILLKLIALFQNLLRRGS